MKINLDDVTNIDSITTINANFDKIVEEFQDKVLYRDSPTGEPNTVENNIDMNGFDIINVKDVYSTVGRWATIEEMLDLNAQALTSKNQSLQYSLDSLQYSQNSMISAYESLTAFNLVQEQYKDLQRFFLGGWFSEPVADNQGNSLQTGCMYLRLTEPTLMRVFNGSAWQDVGSITTTTTNTVDPVLFASTLEAEQGTSTAKVMSPARVKDVIDNQVKSGFTSTGIISSTEDAVLPNDLPNLQQVQSLIDSLVPPGAVLPFAMDTAPTGWLAANGEDVSRTTFSSLFAAIGTRFGSGDGSTTFKLPDLRGEFIRGLDAGRGVDAGRGLGSWQADEFRSHNHTFNFRNITNNSGGGGIDDAGGGWVVYDTNYSGGSETRPRNIALLYCIKT